MQAPSHPSGALTRIAESYNECVRLGIPVLPPDVNDRFRARVVFLLRVFRHRQSDCLVDLQHLGRSNGHEKDENGEEHVDHGRDLKLRFARLSSACACSHML